MWKIDAGGVIAPALATIAPASRQTRKNVANVMPKLRNHASRNDALRMALEGAVAAGGEPNNTWARRVMGFLHFGADPNMFAGGHTVLHVAADVGNLDLLNAALDCGADPNIHNEEVWTPLMAAASVNHDRIVSRLLDAGADPDRQERWSGRTALAIAVLHQHEGVVRELMKGKANPNISPIHYSPVLISAVRIYPESEAEPMVAMLLEGNADPNIRSQFGDDRGRTALTISLHRPRVVSLLLKFNANPNQRNRDGETPLMEVATEAQTLAQTKPFSSWPSVANDYRDSARALLAAGATPSLRGLDPATIDPEILEMVKETAKPPPPRRNPKRQRRVS